MRSITSKGRNDSRREQFGAPGPKSDICRSAVTSFRTKGISSAALDDFPFAIRFCSSIYHGLHCPTLLIFEDVRYLCGM